jgi:hypothetical protein
MARPKGSKDKKPRVRRSSNPSKVVRVPGHLVKLVLDIINKWRSNENKAKKTTKKSNRPF